MEKGEEQPLKKFVAASAHSSEPATYTNELGECVNESRVNESTQSRELKFTVNYPLTWRRRFIDGFGPLSPGEESTFPTTASKRSRYIP